MLHTERHAIHYAAQANQEARLYAQQRLHLTGVTENLQAQLEMDRQEAAHLVSDIVSQGRAEVAAWRTYCNSQVDVASHDERECQTLRAEIHDQIRTISEHIHHANN